MEIHMKKAVYAQYLGNADKSAIKKSTLNIIENTGTFARRQSKMDAKGGNNNNINNVHLKSAWVDSNGKDKHTKDKQSNSNISSADSVMVLADNSGDNSNSSIGSTGGGKKKTFKNMTNKLIVVNRKIFFYLLNYLI
jgi:hypothetical protein